MKIVKTQINGENNAIKAISKNLLIITNIINYINKS